MLSTATDSVPAVITTDIATDAPRRARARRAPFSIRLAQLRSLVGFAALLALWTVLSLTVFSDGRTVPTPFAVARQMFNDRDFYGPHITTTLREAMLGYSWGVGAAVVLAVLFFLVPMIERTAMRLVIAVYCLPLIATGPVLSVTLKGDNPKAALAAQSVVFVTLIGVSLGLRSAQRTWLDVVHVAGGGRWQQLVKVRVRAALPATFAGLKVAGPAAVLGAIIGEYLGQSTRGLGVAMVASQAGFHVPRTWGLAIVMTLLSAAIYAITAFVGRLLCPWEIVGTGGIEAPPPVRARSWWGRALSHAAYFVASIALIVGVWSLALNWFALDSYFAKRTTDVWRYLFSVPAAAENRSEILSALGETLPDAALGYVVGTALAVVVALVMVLWRPFEQMVMPVALAVRSIPLIAMTPLIALVFGRGLTTVLVITGTVTFFPSLVQLMDGLRSAPPQAEAVIRAFGGSEARVLLMARLPYALPSLFAAARITAPLAILGTVLAEWLATGTGIGDLMAQSAPMSAYNTLWACVVVLTACSLVIYSIAATLEGFVLRRFSQTGE